MFSISLRNLLRRKVRSALTLMGIAMGIGAIVALGGIAAGLEEAYSQLLSTSQADLFVSQAKAADISISKVDEAVRERLKAVPGVGDVAGMLLGEVKSGNVPYFIVFGYDPGEFAIKHFNVVEGRGLAAGHEVLLGKMASQNLKKGIGDSIKLSDSTFRIVGIYETGNPLEEGGAVISLRDAQVLLHRPRQVSGVLVRLKRPRDMERVRASIERRFPDLIASTSSDFAQTQEALKMVRAFAWALAFLAVVIGGVGMTNTMLMSVFERTREIGTLRALGWRKFRVLRLILSEALLLSSLGGVGGMVLGVALVKWLGSLPAMGGLLVGHFTPSLFLQAMGVSLLLGSVGGLYPAWWASRLVPVEALRVVDGTGASTRAFPWLGMAGRNLLRRRTRTVLTIIGVGIGIAAIVALQAIADGFVDILTDMVRDMDLTAIEAEVSDMGFSSVPEQVGRRIAALPEVAHVSGIVMSAVTTDQMPFLIVHGYHPADPLLRRFRIVEGTLFSAPRQLILGKRAAAALHKNVGDTLRILNWAFRVVGIYETGISYEEFGAVISLREAQALFGKPRHVSLYAIKLRDPSQAERMKDELEKRFPEISVSLSADFAESLPDIRTTKAMVWGISFLAVLVGGVGMMNTMVMSVFERTREVGVLRALGWQKRRVLALILKESVLLSVLSGLAGIIMAIGMVEALRLSPYGGLIEASFTTPLFIRALSIAFVLGMVGGAYPAWWAASLNPVEALRYE